MQITIEDLLEKSKYQDEGSIKLIKKAYNISNYFHEGQLRADKTPYITHPLNVAYILASMNADANLICAALLHDTLEDTKLTKYQITNYFNDDVAQLVDGVTKKKQEDFKTKEEKDMSNTKKLITSSTYDIRIIILKLADRLHNMKTIDFLSKKKQIENAKETMDLFVPLANYIGANSIKEQLQDLSFKYLETNLYEEIFNKRKQIIENKRQDLEEQINNIKQQLTNKNINYQIKLSYKSIYNMYKDLISNKLIDDCISIEILVDDINKNKEVLDQFKNNKVKIAIKTFRENDQEQLGLLYNFKTNICLQEEFKSYDIYKKLLEINSANLSDDIYLEKVQEEILSEKIEVISNNETVIKLPIFSTPIDFAYKLDSKIGNSMMYAQVNGNYVPNSYELKNKDQVLIITDDILFGPKEDLSNKAHTYYAKRKIKEYIK